MDRYPLRSLVEQLPTATDWLNEEQPIPSFRTRPAPVSGYVWPDVQPPDGALAPIVLIRSSGAMGKTCAARAIAHSIKAPLVDLAHTRVGEDSLTGLLPRALGWSTAAAFTIELQQGRRSLVLDGLDEAQLLVGKESYLAFLSSVLNLVDPAGPPGQVVAFGRHDAIETAHLVVLEQSWEATTIPLLPLSESQTHDLIDTTLDADPKTSINRQHRIPWCRLRDARLDGIAVALMGEDASNGDPWDEVSGFLGYAPVVLAIGENLKVDNPEAELAALESVSPSTSRLDRGRLLKGIVDDVLERERQKVSSHLVQTLELEDAALGTVLYTADEQIVRVIAATTGELLIATPPQSLPVTKKPLYEDLIAPWVLDHPFLQDREFANVVFRDYVRAFVATSEFTEIFGLKRLELVAACGPVGPFFSYFVHAMTATPRDEHDEVGTGLITEDLVDDVVRSNALSVDSEPYAIYTHSAGQEHAHLSIGELGADRPLFVFHLDSPDGVLILRSPLSRFFVDTAHSVGIESTDDRVDLGPRLLILARELEISGSKVAAYSSPDDVGAVLASESVSHIPDISVKAYGDGALVVSWPEPTFQWRPYLLEDAPDDAPYIAPYARQRLYFSLRRLLTGFRPGAEPWMYYERYDNYVVGSNPLLSATRDSLLDLGVLKRSGDQYSLDLERLGSYGVNYAALSQENWQSCLGQLSLDVLKDEQVVDAL